MNRSSRLMNCPLTEKLTKVPKQQLREIGWRKAAEMVKVAPRDGERFDCAPWVHKAKDLNREEFEREVERHLTGKESEPWELIYFKMYKSQLMVIEQALETAALMLGTNKSRGYCLETICADFLAGANLENGSTKSLLLALSRLFSLLPQPEKAEFLAEVRKAS